MQQRNIVIRFGSLLFLALLLVFVWAAWGWGYGVASAVVLAATTPMQGVAVVPVPRSIRLLIVAALLLAGAFAVFGAHGRMWGIVVVILDVVFVTLHVRGLASTSRH